MLSLEKSPVFQPYPEGKKNKINSDGWSRFGQDQEAGNCTPVSHITGTV